VLRSLRVALAGGVCGLLLIAEPIAQQETLPSTRLVPAPRLAMPGAVDSNVPMIWDLVDGAWRVFAVASWGGIPVRMSGSAMDQMHQEGPVAIGPHPGYGIWIESIIPDEAGTWYAYYHHEVPAFACQRPDRAVPRVGSARSFDRGLTWEDLGVVLEAPAENIACGSSNRFVVGGLGDVSVMRAPGGTDLFLYFSQYSKVPSEQGVAVARLAWADRDAPGGRAMIWQNGAWLPATRIAGTGESGTEWSYPTGTPLVPVSRPWHDGNVGADAFWGPSLHWNQYLERYVMLLNRAKDEAFNNEGIYVSFARVLDDPRAWSAPRKVMNGGGWYPQVAGLEPTTGTDKQAGQRAQFLITGRSEHYIEFQR